MSSNLGLISREIGKCASARVKGNAGGPLNHLILRWTTVVACIILIIRVLWKSPSWRCGCGSHIEGEVSDSLRVVDKPTASLKAETDSKLILVCWGFDRRSVKLALDANAEHALIPRARWLNYHARWVACRINSEPGWLVYHAIEGDYVAFYVVARSGFICYLKVESFSANIDPVVLFEHSWDDRVVLKRSQLTYRFNDNYNWLFNHHRWCCRFCPAFVESIDCHCVRADIWREVCVLVQDSFCGRLVTCNLYEIVGACVLTRWTIKIEGYYASVSSPICIPYRFMLISEIAAGYCLIFMTVDGRAHVN